MHSPVSYSRCRERMRAGETAAMVSTAHALKCTRLTNLFLGISASIKDVVQLDDVKQRSFPIQILLIWHILIMSSATRICCTEMQRCGIEDIPSIANKYPDRGSGFP